MLILEVPGVESFATLLGSHLRSLSDPKKEQYPTSKDLHVDLHKVTSVVCSPYYRALSLYQHYQKNESLTQFLIRCKSAKQTKTDPHLLSQVYYSHGTHTLDQSKLEDRYPYITYAEYMRNLANYLPLYNSEALRLVETVYEEDFDQLGYVPWTSFSMTSLQAAVQQEMVFLSAQPDELYFHWQVEVYSYAFARMGLQDRLVILFGYKDKPSARAQELSKYFRVFFYPDTRTDVTYIPSIRPHILKQYFAEHAPSCVFYHDADIVFTRLPAFEEMKGSCVSNTISYIGAKYLERCGQRFKDKHQVAKSDLLERMCEIVGISAKLVKSKERESGGAQYILHNLDSAFWEKVEHDSVALFQFMNEYHKKYPVAHGVQSWCADMWAVLWNFWRRGQGTTVHKEMEFSWATNTTAEYYKHPIFHLAGVTAENQKGKFYKNNYAQRDAIEEFYHHPELLETIETTSATHVYVELMRDYAHYKRQRALFSTLPLTRVESLKNRDIQPTLHSEKHDETGYLSTLLSFFRASHICLG